MSAMSPVIVVARWQMSAEAVEGVLGMVAELGRLTLQEPGCLGYDVFRSTDTPGQLLLLERYRDNEAIEAHRGSTHYQELAVKRILPLLTERTVELLEARDVG
jgi:quinol monooxygenase YgiN